MTEARAYIEGTTAKPRCRDKKIGDAYSEYYDAITDRQYLHKAAVKARVGKWIGVFGPDRMVSEVTSAELATYLARCARPRRRLTMRFRTSGRLCLVREVGTAVHRRRAAG